LICIIFYNNTQAQCTVFVPSSTLQHIACPNGGAVGFASMSQNSYSNFSWYNTTNGQLYNGGGGSGGTSRSDLDAGTYQITASGGACPTSVSNYFTILESEVNFNFNPTQACPNLCNVIVSASMGVTIPGVSYGYQFDSNPIVSLPNNLPNQCGGPHTYEITANGLACGIKNIGVSQFAQMNLASVVTNSTCAQLGSSTVSITGVGASGLSTYCSSKPKYNIYSRIDNVSIIGDNTSISNNTSANCDIYQDYTSQSADVTPGNTYNLTVDLGSCNSTQAFVDIAKVYIDWNIDGDFYDLNELVGQISAIQSPSSTSISINVPIGAIPGQSRMRVVAQNATQAGNPNNSNPCDDEISWFGSTEDYTIQINGSVATPVNYLWSDGQTTATATNLSAGNYTVTITDANSCTASTTSVVTGNGSGNVTSVIAGTNQTICNGGTPANLTATGNSSGGLYSWSPSSAFTNPNLQNPNFNPSGINATSIYMVTFTDASGCTATDNVTITVNPVPSVTLSAVPNPACEGDDIVLTAVASTGFPYEYKFMYNDGTGWSGNSVTTPAWDINNSVIYNNITQSTQFRVKVRENSSCLTSSWSPIIAVTVNWLPSLPGVTSETACLGGVVPDLLAVGTLPTWYSDQALTTQVYQGNWYATGQTAVGLYTYYVTETNLYGCEGAAVPVTLEIYAIPSAPTATNEVACEGGVIPDLTTTVATSTPTFWYSDAGLTAVIGNGSTFATGQTTAGIYTYYVSETDVNGCESAGTTATLEIYAIPITTPILHN